MSLPLRAQVDWTPHLKRLEETATTTAVLHLVLVTAQAHHGLAVDV